MDLGDEPKAETDREDRRSTFDMRSPDPVLDAEHPGGGIDGEAHQCGKQETVIGAE